VRTQIWIAISVYVLVAMVKKHLGLDLSLYTITQILSVSLFEKTELSQALTEFHGPNSSLEIGNQLALFDL
jgi:hypothetical protein